MPDPSYLMAPYHYFWEVLVKKFENLLLILKADLPSILKINDINSQKMFVSFHRDIPSYPVAFQAIKYRPMTKHLMQRMCIGYPDKGHNPTP